MSDVTVALGGRTVLDGVELGVTTGELVAIVGPNGAGKSTLLAVLAGDRRPEGGRVVLDGRPVEEWRPLDLARRRAVMLQDAGVAFPFRVDEVIRMGRSPWRETRFEDDDDREVAAAMVATDVAHLAGRAVPTLSGGERARVALARTLAQRTTLILLDEPTAALDLHHQELAMGLLRARVDAGDAAVVVLHDLTAAAAFADRVVIVADGGVVAAGTPGEVLRGECLTAVYRQEIAVACLDDGSVVVVPRRRRPAGVAGSDIL
ncbi:MAG: heme ABC transporter ATP-binding protein [Acidimicrobiales bacterium]|jgi:iron complex transport system ATP-binding protein|nr:heme ABC transporter ATP-binding protein [Acidimicrobiales bacterium]